MRLTTVMIVVALFTGCNKPTAADYHGKISSHLTMIKPHELQVKQGHNFFWVMFSYSDAKTSARFNVMAKAPPENGNVAVEFRKTGTRGQVGVFQFQDNMLSLKPVTRGTPDEIQAMEATAVEIANAIYRACP